MKALEHELRAKFGARVRASMPLAELTSFRIGGPADLFVNVENEAELMHAKAAAYRAGVPCFCLGAGTNLLVSDRGMRGLVVRLGDGFGKIEIDGTKVVAGAGAAVRRAGRGGGRSRVLRGSNSAKAFPARSAADW